MNEHDQPYHEIQDALLCNLRMEEMREEMLNAIAPDTTIAEPTEIPIEEIGYPDDLATLIRDAVNDAEVR